MRSLTRTLAVNLRKRQAGFTLVELLVVVGIIVALGAVIVPNVLRFASSGEKGANTAEAASVQTAIDTMMTSQNPPLTAVTAQSGIAPEDDFGATGALDLSGFLRLTDTEYFYCWDATGLLTYPLQSDINGEIAPPALCP